MVISLNISNMAEPAKRVAERLAGEARFKTPQTRAEAGEISASAEHRSPRSGRGAERPCFVICSKRKKNKVYYKRAMDGELGTIFKYFLVIYSVNQ